MTPCGIGTPSRSRSPESATTPWPATAPRSDHPEPHTDAELAYLLPLRRAAVADIIAVGYGRPVSVTAARALAGTGVTAGGAVLAMVDRPTSAASWLRPARRLVAGHTGAWIIADNPADRAQLARRLADQPARSAARSFGVAVVASPDLVALAGPGVLTGTSGALPTVASGTSNTTASSCSTRSRLGDSVRTDLPPSRATYHRTRRDPPPWMAGHRPAAAGGRGLARVVDGTCPDQGGVPSGRAPHVRSHRLPALALAALPLHTPPPTSTASTSSRSPTGSEILAAPSSPPPTATTATTCLTPLWSTTTTATRGWACTRTGRERR